MSWCGPPHGRARARTVLASIAACVLFASASRAAPSSGRPSVLGDIDELDDEAAANVTWRQILMAPRITGNLRAVALDPTDPKKIYVGTEEGTIVHSENGGVTWDETELSPFTLQSPAPPVLMFGDDYSAIGPFGGFNVLVGTNYYPFPATYRRSAGQGVPITSPPMTNLPSWFVFPVRIGTPTPETLLGTLANQQPKPYEEVRQIVVCPGGAFSILATTRVRLWGSPDGSSFVPLYLARDSAPIEQVTCSPADPNEVILATGDGTLRSTDGGVSFDTIGQVGSNAVSFGPSGDDEGRPTFFLATGTDLWIGDSAKADAMRLANLATEGGVRWIEATPKSIWVATDTGVRVSRDGGRKWSQVDDLEGFRWTMVADSPGEPEHIAVLGPDNSFVSTDGGHIFRPFFREQTRRRLRQIVSAPARAEAGRDNFLLITSGELWSTTDAEPQGDAVSPAIRSWAQRRIRDMPSLFDTLQRALVKARLTDVQLESIYSSLKARGWVPGVRLTAQMNEINTLQQGEATITNPQGTTSVVAQRPISFFADLVWELPDLMAPSYDFTPARKDLYTLRKNYEYVIEDAYDERKQVLAQILAGGLDVQQVLTLKARVDVLDALLIQFAEERNPR